MPMMELTSVHLLVTFIGIFIANVLAMSDLYCESP
jgi:hypothetical protein